MPPRPKMATAPVIGTASATVIQSMPSMKFTRLTNHTPSRTRQARSIQSGSVDASRVSAGSSTTTRPTASNCTSRRGAGESVWMSSSKPISVSNPMAAVSVDSKVSVPAGNGPASAAASHVTINVASTTPRPPPWGVGSRCDERSTGCASAEDLSHGSSSTRALAQSAAARIGIPMIVQDPTSAPLIAPF